MIFHAAGGFWTKTVQTDPVVIYCCFPVTHLFWCCHSVPAKIIAMSKYFIFGVISLGLLMVAISGTAVSVAFPIITSSFGISLILAGWVLTIFQLVATVTMPLAGKAGDIFGVKKIFMLSLSSFTLGSLLCALAPNIELLILFRTLQGVGAGSFLPVATSIAAKEFPGSRQQAIGLFTSIFPIGQIIGPNLGGWLVEAFGWRSVFWVNVPIGVIAIVAAAFLLRGEEREKGQVDLIGAGLLTASVFAFLMGLSQLGNGNGSWFGSGVLFASTGVMITTFVWYERRTKEPIIDLEVLSERPFLAANIFNFVMGACVMGVMAFIPLYAVSIFNMTVFQSGFVLTPRSVAMILASTLTSMFLVRWGYRQPMLIGTLLTTANLILLGAAALGLGTTVGVHVNSVVLVSGVMLLAGVGMGIQAPAANNACIELMPDRVATITGVRGMFRQIGGAVSIAVTSLVLQRAGDMEHGFFIVFTGLAAVMLVTIPAIFMMPASPKDVPSA